LTIHVEAAPNPRPLLDEIHQLGAAAGISLNPITPVSALEGCLDLCDLVLVMSVTPGFGGQEFNPVTLERLRHLREMLDPAVLLSVDGGIQHDTIGDCARAGADLLVTGSALFSQEDYGKFMEEMTALAISAKNVHV
jgi:ribulose-phosphate 3-epimerase